MKPIRLAFSDFPGPFNPKKILKLLMQRFPIVIDQIDPQFVIYSVFGCEFLKYKNAVRIFFTGENVSPDFNLCDYAFGFDWIKFEDRYIRCPNYVLYDQYKDLIKRKRSDTINHSVSVTKTRFCNFIYSNSAGNPYRDELFNLLQKQIPVDSPGDHLKNIETDIGMAYKGDWTIPKVEFQKQYRFTIACENASFPGYTTEKIVHALASDTIPIYWGNPQVNREFNHERFINCHDFNSIDEVVDRVIEIEGDSEKFETMLSKPFFPNDQLDPELSEDFILNQFTLIFEQQHSKAFRRNLGLWGKKYETQKVREVKAASLLIRKGSPK